MPFRIHQKLKVGAFKRNHHAKKLQQPGEQLTSNVVEIKNILSNDPKWPLVMCIPQYEEISENFLTKVMFSSNPKRHNSWIPLETMQTNVQTNYSETSIKVRNCFLKPHSAHYMHQLPSI